MVSDGIKPDGQLGYLLTQVSFLKQRIINNALRELDVTYVQFIILAGVLELGTDDAVVTQQIVANERRLDKAMVSNVVKTLVSKGWLIREEHAEDRRAYVLSLTGEGEKVAWEAKRIALDIDRSFFASVDRTTLASALGSLLENNKEQLD